MWKCVSTCICPHMCISSAWMSCLHDDDVNLSGLLQSGVSRLGFNLSRIIVPPSLSFPSVTSEGRGQKGGAIWMDNKAVNKVIIQLNSTHPKQNYFQNNVREFAPGNLVHALSCSGLLRTLMHGPHDANERSALNATWPSHYSIASTIAAPVVVSFALGAPARYLLIIQPSSSSPAQTQNAHSRYSPLLALSTFLMARRSSFLITK